MSDRSEMTGELADIFLDGAAHEASGIDIAEAILAAGYWKLRTVTTVEELDALPRGTRFLAQGTMYMRVGPALKARSEFGEEFALSEFGYRGFSATVLDAPEPQS